MRLQNGQKIVNNLPLLLVVIVAAVLVWVNVEGFAEVAESRPAFVQFTSSQVLTDTSALCPGDQVATSSSIRVNKPVIILRSTQYWRAGAPTAATTADHAYTAIGKATEFPEIPRSWTVPDLMPGDYERHTVFVLPGQGADSTAMVVPFTIREGCGE